MLYDYLFYKSYQLAQKSGNFDDTPILGGIWFFMGGFLFNISTVLLLVDDIWGSSISASGIFTTWRYVFAGLFLSIMLLYFKHQKRWKKLVSKYEEKEKTTGKSIHPAIVLTAYYVISVLLLFLSAMHKNGDGLFG